MLSIANLVQNGIILEADHPGRNDDRKLAILDMKFWLDDNRLAVYQLYEKSVSNKQVIHAQSAVSSKCKFSVHVNEIIRRILNTSSRLDWNDQTAPILTEYMVRRKEAFKAFKNHDRILKYAEEGRKPVNRPKEWQKEERRKGGGNKLGPPVVGAL